MKKTYLMHHGIKGQRWGLRRFQNEDGSLTSAGRKRYDVNEDGTAQLKTKYTRNQKLIGGVKTAIGTTLVTKSILDIIKTKGTKEGFSSKSGKKTLNSSIFKTLLGAAVITSGVKNFMNSNMNKTINTVGKGATPEVFSGKPKTIAQLEAAAKKAKATK